MTEYRKVTPEEKLHVSRIQNIVFGGGDNEKEIREQIAKGEYDSENTYGAVDETGRVVAGMEIISYIMWFDGHKVPMYGIAGVASLPEIRRQGNVRKIFEKVFDDIYEKGAVFSHLYPFSYDYYRKFGYENCGAVKKYNLQLDAARRLKNNGTAHEFIKKEDTDNTVRDKLIEIYEDYASKHNIMLSRSQERWDEVFDISLFGSNRLYYWKNEASEIKSWAKFRKKDDIMEINDIAWLDNESMLGILQFMGMFEGAAEKMSVRASPEFVPDLYWNDLYDIETENQWMGMNRVVDAKRALELIKKPCGENARARDNSGRFTIKVNDKFAKWNNNTYIVEYGGGESAVKTASDISVTPDIEVSETALMQLVLGVYEFEPTAHRYDVQVNGNRQTLKNVFCKKNMLIMDYF